MSGSAKFRFLLVRFFCFVFVFIAAGCGSMHHKVIPSITSDVYAVPDNKEKISGKYELSISDDIKNIKLMISPIGSCSAHSYQIELGNKLESSITRTLRNFFEEVNNPKTKSGLIESSTNPKIDVRLEYLKPSILCPYNCTSTTELALNIYVQKQTRKLINTRIFSTQSASGSNLLGSHCQDGDELISKSINLAIKDSMEQLAERLINPNAPRNYAELNDQPKEHEKKETVKSPIVPSPQSGTGSGFFVSKMGHVITNAHVVQNCKKITIGDNANKQVPAELINTDRSNDLALLKLSTLEMA
jgi:S1-C subfamily serine protease